MKIRTNGIELYCEDRGEASAPALILIRGLGTQIVHWPTELLTGFVDAGYRTICFDNRDVGLSARCPKVGLEDSAEDILAMVERGESLQSAYHIDDMARDVVGLMDQLDIDKAHILGMSMGGGITQVMAVEHHERLLSATIIMSAARFGGPAILPLLLAYPQSREEFIESAILSNHAWGCSGFPITDEDVAEVAARAFDRGAEPDAVNRQALAVATSMERSEKLKKLDLPTLVIHGADDTLIPPSAGREIADLIPKAHYCEIAGMGHSITPLLSPEIVRLVTDFIGQE